MSGLNPIEKLFCADVTEKLMAHDLAIVFLHPVDPVRDELPDYPQKVKEPMDLSTLSSKLESGAYRNVGEWKQDLMRIWDNAVLYHTEAGAVGMLAKKMKRKALKMTRMIPKTETGLWVSKLTFAAEKVRKLVKDSPAAVTTRLPK